MAQRLFSSLVLCLVSRSLVSFLEWFLGWWDWLVGWEMWVWEWLKNQAGEEEMNVMGGGNRLVGERFVSACGYEKARRVWTGRAEVERRGVLSDRDDKLKEGVIRPA